MAFQYMDIGKNACLNIVFFFGGGCSFRFSHDAKHLISRGQPWPTYACKPRFSTTGCRNNQSTMSVFTHVTFSVTRPWLWRVLDARYHVTRGRVFEVRLYEKLKNASSKMITRIIRPVYAWGEEGGGGGVPAVVHPGFDWFVRTSPWKSTPSNYPHRTRSSHWQHFRVENGLTIV